MAGPRRTLAGGGLPVEGQTAQSKDPILRAGGCRRGTGSRGGQRALPERGRAAPRPPAGDRRTGMEGHPLAPLGPKERTHGLPRGQRGGLETTSTLSVPLGPRGRGGEVREGEESQVNHEGWMTQCEAQAPPPPHSRKAWRDTFGPLCWGSRGGPGLDVVDGTRGGPRSPADPFGGWKMGIHGPVVGKKELTRSCMFGVQNAPTPRMHNTCRVPGRPTHPRPPFLLPSALVWFYGSIL